MPTPRVSFEFFPPKSLEASFRLWDTVNTLSPLEPQFVSVTYGAGGTTRKLTHEAVEAIHNNYNLNVAAHLTCVDASREETLAIAESYAEIGVTEIVALRGDAPQGQSRFTPRADGFASAPELIEALAKTGKFNIRVGAYPDRHPEAACDQADIDWLKRKIDAGAHSAITQFFFEAETFFRFRDRCVAAGVTALALSPTFLVAVLVVVVIGGGTTGYQSLSNTIALNMTEPSHQGRVQSLMQLSFAGFGIAALPLGLLAEAIGRRQAMAIMGALAVAAIGVYYVLERNASVEIEAGDPGLKGVPLVAAVSSAAAPARR